jgi:hypothetical protein
MAHGTFSTLLNCMDGRCQEKALAYAKNLFGTDFVDSITEPGIDGILSGHHSVLKADELPAAIEWVKAKAGISAKGHGSKKCLIVGHCECAGNQTGFEEHQQHIMEAKATIEGWELFDEVHMAVFNPDWEIVEMK